MASDYNNSVSPVNSGKGNLTAPPNYNRRHNSLVIRNQAMDHKKKSISSLHSGSASPVLNRPRRMSVRSFYWVLVDSMV